MVSISGWLVIVENNRRLAIIASPIVLKAIFKVYNLDVNYKEIKYHYFLSIYTLSNYVEDQIIKYGK